MVPARPDEMTTHVNMCVSMCITANSRHESREDVNIIMSIHRCTPIGGDDDDKLTQEIIKSHLFRDRRVLS